MKAQTTKPLETANGIFVRRSRKLMITQESSERPAEKAHLASFVKNLESLGYVASSKLVDAASKLSLIDLTALNNDALNALRKARGAHLPFKPMYPNFPSQVMNMNEGLLYFKALLHYWTNGQFLPYTEKAPRPLLSNQEEEIKLQQLELGTTEDFEKIFTKLASSNSSISASDKDDLTWFIRQYGDEIKRLLPAKMPHREVKAFICANLFELTSKAQELVPTYCDTATDVLRLAVALSGGDVSLAKPTKFLKFSRSQRRILLNALESQKNVVEDMLRWKGRWIRLGERLHPSEYRMKNPQTAKAFDALRNNLHVETFNSRLENALERKDVPEVLSMVRSRPGDFARRLDHALRLATDKHSSVVETFSGACDRVSTPVLLQVMHHFAMRNSPSELRVFLPKGDVAKAQAIKNTLPSLPADVCDSIKTLCASTLSKRFAQLPPLGKCYVDPELKNFPVPFSQRSASKSLRTASRGSRLPLPEGDTLRFFVWWKNGRERTDLDLSAVMLDRNFNYVAAVTYYDLINFGGHHSGDIVDAPNGASEFIDLSKERCTEKGVRYIVMSVNSYTSQPYCDLPECFAGWMSRVKPDSGEIYEPKTVQDKLDISSNMRIAIPAVFDLGYEEVIWADMTLARHPKFVNNVAGNFKGLQLTLKSMVEMSKPNLYDLLKLHAEARGELVENALEAQHVFSVANGTPFDLTSIASEYMQT